MQGAAKVGMLVVVFLVLLYGGYMVLGHDLLAPPKSTYYAEFPDAGGIASGSSVRMAGVKVGTIEEVKLQSPTLARMTLKIDQSIKIPAGSTALIPTSLI